MTAGFGGHFLHVGQCWGASVFLISLISWGRSHPNLTEEEETGEETAKEGAWALLVCAKPWLQPSASGLPWLLLPLLPQALNAFGTQSTTRRRLVFCHLLPPA